MRRSAIGDGCVVRAALAGALVVCSAHAALPSLADCDGPTAVTLAPEDPTTAALAPGRAVWLDGHRLVWPGVADGGRFRLLQSASAALQLRVGDVPAGVDRAWTLRDLGPGRAEPEARWRWVGPGRLLALRGGADALALREALRGQLVVVHEDDVGRLLAAARVQAAAALDALYAPAAERLADYGAHRAAGGWQVRLWAPTAQAVHLCRYADAEGRAQSLQAMRRDEESGSWQVRWRGQGPAAGGPAYTFLVDVVVPGVGLVRNRVTDPYSLSLTTDSRRSWALDLADPALAPPGWARTPRPARVRAATDLVVYELHVRDFSIGDTTVRPSHRGRYGAFTDSGSHGMRHLARLARAGVTDVHLLPVFDIASVPETGCVTPTPSGPPDSVAQQAAVAAVKAVDCFNWGYDPLHYTAPEGSYASDAADGRVRIVEFRRMVQALHRLGLRVGMDVVYNHTSASGQHPQSVLDRIVPGYYHRLDVAGRVERSTCCDNTATEHRMMAKLMIDSVVVWARDHRIDSFRFDLMGHQPREVMLELQRRVDAAAGRHVHLIGEGWNFGEVKDGARFVQASQLSLQGSGIGTFSDRGRDAVRGGSAGDNGVDQLRRQGWVNGLYYDPNAEAAGRATRADLLAAADLVRVGLAGTLRDFEMVTADGTRRPLARIAYGDQPAGYAAAPGEVVNYVENHDNQTLFDANVFKLPTATSREDRARAQVLGAAVVAFSQGIAYLHAGQEALRSKSMDRNSFDSGDWFNPLDWTFTDNGFGRGLPPADDNRTSWPWMQPRLADASIKPTPADIAWTRDAVTDLLRIRASSRLFRLPTAAEVQRRLTFVNTGPLQEPTVIAAHLRGDGWPGARFAELVYLINVDQRAHAVTVEAARGRDFVLHPVHRGARAADRRAATGARFDAASGRFEVPARTAVVFVRH